MITQTGNYRITITETNILPQITVEPTRKAIFVIDSEMGPDYPYLVDNVNDLLRLYGTPTNQRNGVLEVLPYISRFSAYLVRAIHPDASYAGVDVSETEIVPFGPGAKRTTYSFSNIQRAIKFKAGDSDGLTASYSGTFPYSDSNDTYIPYSAELYIGGNKITLSTNDGISYTFGNNSTLAFSGNQFSLNFTGTPGQVAELNCYNLINGIDLSAGLTLANDVGFNLYLDNIVVLNLTLSSGNYATASDIANALNSAFQSATGLSISPFSIDSTSNAPNEYLVITGTIASSTEGRIKITNPSDFTLSSAIPVLFDSSSPTEINETASSTNPTGDIPSYDTDIEIYVKYNDVDTSNISHSFYAFSKYNDDFYNLAIQITQNSYNTYTLVLYEYANGNYTEIGEYTYSLDPNAKDQFGFSIYIEEVFKNNEYIKPVLNPNFNGTMNLGTSPIVNLSGGSSGGTITTTELGLAWDKVNDKKYRSHLLVDLYGGFAQKLSDLIKNQHFYAFGITRVPNGINPSNAVLYAKSLNLKDDAVALYFNRIKILHPYTRSEVYVSGLGDLATRFMEQEPDFDGFSPAFVDKENGYGGQLTYFTPIELEYDLTESEKEALDNVLVNPIVIDEIYGLMAYGDRTLDPNVYINERRVSSNLIEKIIKRVLTKTIGALNTPVLRKQVELEIMEILTAALASGVITNPVVQCDENNNKEELAKGGRKLIVDVFISVPPSIQRIHLRFTRSGSTINVQQ